MEKLVINIKNKKDSRLIKELLLRLDIEIENDKSTKKQYVGKNKFKSKEDFLSFAGSMKGQLISKKHLRNIALKKRI